MAAFVKLPDQFGSDEGVQRNSQEEQRHGTKGHFAGNPRGGGITQEKDWYPFVMTFNDSAGFRQFIREKAGKLNLGKKIRWN